MNNCGNSVPSPLLRDSFAYYALHWTPRLVVAGVAGFYSLGVAYDLGIMAEIDRLAIKILRHHMGYIGIGAVMPTVQWYAAWGVRITATLGAGILYDLTEKTIFKIAATLKSPSPEEIAL